MPIIFLAEEVFAKHCYNLSLLQFPHFGVTMNVWCQGVALLHLLPGLIPVFVRILF